MSESPAGKTDKRRPQFISDKVWGLRYDLATGRITVKEFWKKMKEIKKKGKAV